MSRPRIVTSEQESQISELFENTELTLEEIADTLSIGYKIVWSFVARIYSPEIRLRRKQRSYRNSRMGDLNPSFGKRRSDAFHWQGGDHVEDGNGYWIVPKPEWYTGRKGSKYVFEHSVVVCAAIGITEIPAGFVVHHIDRNRKNNDINNLVLLTNAAHSRLHAIERVETISKESRKNN